MAEEHTFNSWDMSHMGKMGKERHFVWNEDKTRTISASSPQLRTLMKALPVYWNGWYFFKFGSFLTKYAPWRARDLPLIIGIFSSYQQNLLFLSAESSLPISRAAFHFFPSAEYVLLTDGIAFSLVHVWAVTVADLQACICFCAVIPKSCSSALNLGMQP